jgi:hypothetical protein
MVISSAFLFSCKLRSGRSFQYWRIGYFCFQINNPLEVSRGVLGKLLLLFSGKSFGSFFSRFFLCTVRFIVVK